jgi:hypothetical protein
MKTIQLEDQQRREAPDAETSACVLFALTVFAVGSIYTSQQLATIHTFETVFKSGHVWLKVKWE